MKKGNRNFLPLALSVVLSVLFVTVAVNAATTISTNINTGGTLTVTGDAAIDTDTLYVDASTDRTGVGTTTPSAMFSVGEGAGTVTGDAYFTGGLTVGGTAKINSIEGSILFAATASNPTGVTQGTVYYNSGSKVLRLYDGTQWATVATSTGGAGLDVSGARIDLNALTSYLTIGTSTQVGLSVLTLEATSTAAIPLTIKAYNGQTANLMQFHNVGGTELFAIDKVGNASTTAITASGDLYVNGFATTTATNGNVATQGTLTVTGASTFTGAISANGNVTLGNAAADVVTITGNASTSAITTAGNLYVGGFATTTSTSGNFLSQGSIGSGTTTASTEISALSAATTTVYLHSSSATKGGCLQLEGPDGTIFRAYATTSGPMYLTAGSCK